MDGALWVSWEFEEPEGRVERGTRQFQNNGPRLSRAK